jgi:hypothetical protein
LLDEPLEKAQTELALAEVAFIEATARVESAREAAARLVAAVAALNGETPVGPSATFEDQGKSAERPDHTPPEAYPADRPPERAEAAAMSPEEFDKERIRRQRAREKEQIANNPLGHLKCPGCGVQGKMNEQVVTTPKGGVIKALVCGGCGNQAIMS